MTSTAKWRAVWADRSLVLCLLALVAPQELAQLLQVDKACRSAVRREMKRFRRASARLGLALWCSSHVELEFQSYFQEIETHQISRSAVHDPRVPPRVVSTWAERGEVPGGLVALRPERLPKQNERGLALRFTPTSAEQRPMLTNVVQHQRRIYTVVTLQIARHRQGSEERQDKTVLRRLWYLKECGEWRAMVPAAEKRRFDANGGLCRYDLVSLDGSIALELDVPRGADSMMDYYLVKRATVFLPIEELMYPFVNKIRPTRALPEAARSTMPVRRCLIVLSFGRLDGGIDATYRIPAQLTVEQQQPQPIASSPPDAGTTTVSSNTPSDTPPVSHLRTGMEHFDIVTIKHLQATKVEVPLVPGYLWLSLVDDHPSPAKPLFYYTTAMLHGGATRSRASLEVDAKWLPGTITSWPTPQSRHRRTMKGFFHLAVAMDSFQLTELSIVAQHLPAVRIERYAATIESYARP